MGARYRAELYIETFELISGEFQSRVAWCVLVPPAVLGSATLPVRVSSTNGVTGSLLRLFGYSSQRGCVDSIGRLILLSIVKTYSLRHTIVLNGDDQCHQKEILGIASTAIHTPECVRVGKTTDRVRLV